MSLLSSSNAKHGAMSSVLNDLEAEGCTKVATITFLTSRSISSEDRINILQTLFHVEPPGSDVMAVAVKSTTATEQGEPQEVGFAVATPTYSVSETSIAAQSSGGTLLYAVHWNDILRGGLEGIFDLLTPVIERILASASSAAIDTSQSKLLVLFVGLPSLEDDDNAITQATQVFQQAAATSLAYMAPNPYSSLTQIFKGGVLFFSSTDAVHDFIHDSKSSLWKDLPTALAEVTRSTANLPDYISSTSKILATSPTDLAAVRRLLPISRQALQQFIESISQAAETSLDISTGFKEMKPMDTFGELADAAIQRSLDFYDVQMKSASTSVAQSSLSQRIRSHLITEIHSTILLMYEVQLEQLYQASMEGFKAGLSKLRISPNLGSDMNKVSTLTLQSFQTASKKLFPKALSSTTLSVPSASLLSAKLGKELREFITLRLLAARADGKFKPIPRKGVTLGFHWLLPKPFGNDYRQEPWMVHTKDDLVFVPKDKITDVAKEDIMGSTTEGEDWTRKIIPCPAANEMIYMK